MGTWSPYMTVEEIQAGVRHWLARWRASSGGRHLTVCHETLSRLCLRLGWLSAGICRGEGTPRVIRVAWDGKKWAPEQQIPVQDEAEMKNGAEAGIPEDQDEDPDLQTEEADPAEVERVAKVAGELGREGARKMLEILRDAHEKEVELEAEALKREYRRILNKPLGSLILPGDNFFLDLIARLRVHDPVQVVTKLTDADLDQEAKLDPIMDFLIYAEEFGQKLAAGQVGDSLLFNPPGGHREWIQEALPTQLEAIAEFNAGLDAAKEYIRGSLVEQLEAHEEELTEQLEEQAKGCLPYPGHCEAEVELNRLVGYMVETYPQELRPDEPLVGMVTRLLYEWGNQPKPEDRAEELTEQLRPEPPYPGYCEEELNRLARELVERYPHEVRPSESAVDMALRLMATWGSQPKLVDEELTVEQRERLTGMPERRTEPTRCHPVDCDPDNAGPEPELWPDPQRHEKFDGCGVERCPVEPEAAPIQFPPGTEFTEAPTPLADVGAVHRERPEVAPILAAADAVLHARNPKDFAAAQLAYLKMYAIEPEAEPTQCEQVERLNSRAVRDEAGRVYVRHLTIAPPGEDTIVGPMLRLGNLLEMIDLAVKHPHSIFEPRFVEKTVERAQKEVELLGRILSP